MGRAVALACGLDWFPPEAGRIFRCVVCRNNWRPRSDSVHPLCRRNVSSSAAGPRAVAPRRLNGPRLSAFCAAVPGTTIHRTSARPTRNQPDNRNDNIGFRVASTLCARAIAITVTMGAHDKRSGPFMMTMVRARVEMGARYRGGACLGRPMGSGRRHRF
jgi:hypothetical protein